MTQQSGPWEQHTTQPYGWSPPGNAPAHGGGAWGQPQLGPPGRVRSTGVGILLTIVTLGFYTWYWWYCVHDEMKRHKGHGLGGGLALLLTIFVHVAMPFVTSSEVGELYTQSGRPARVSGWTGLWFYPGVLLLLIGPVVWFVKTNNALNDYWRSVGAPG